MVALVCSPILWAFRHRRISEATGSRLDTPELGDELSRTSPRFGPTLHAAFGNPWVAPPTTGVASAEL